MTHYLAFVHKDPGGCHGVSFPDVPGIIAPGDTLDEAVDQAAEALAFAAGDRHRYTDAVWVAVPLRAGLREAA